MKLSRALPILVAGLSAICFSQGLRTRWTQTVTAANAHREYPRPQMVREGWVNLNGEWDYSVGSSHGKILVPFPIESELSGVQRPLRPDETLIYRRTFRRPSGGRILLHFGAVDWRAAVFVNGKQAGTHEGGYDPFSFDITSLLTKEGDQSLEVRVTDPSDRGPQPRGKQVLKPGGIFYRATSGIWQTVWLESVPETYIENLKVDADPKSGEVSVTVNPKGIGITKLARVTILENGREIARGEKGFRFHENLPEDPGREAYPLTLKLQVSKPRLWSPEDPKLYQLKVQVLAVNGKGPEPQDQVSSYFAFRSFGIAKDKDGINKFFLNGKPYFLMGTLDQGFWPDGGYTAPNDAALKYDLDVQKRLGFNFIRKHVKVEPERWYYWCDKIGLLVLQDMPSGDRSIGPDDPDIERTPESQSILKTELKAMVDTHRNHPSIFGWVLYNEGWGQWNTVEMTKWLQDLDPARVVDSVTGWADRGVGAFKDWHIYPGPGAPTPDNHRAVFLGEYGGLGLPVPGHMWKATGWGYQSYKTSRELTDAFCDLMFQLRLIRGESGLSGAVYTQTTDVETELNGLMTYDRAMIKMDEARIRRAIRDVNLDPPKITTILPTSESTPQVWTISTTNPGKDWVKAQPWKHERSAKGGFGTAGTPGAIIGTTWDTSDIWLRRTFETAESWSDGVYLRISYDDDVEVYLDGKRVYQAPGWTTSYKLVKIGSLSRGPHDLRIHVHQNKGGQYIDAGLVLVK